MISIEEFAAMSGSTVTELRPNWDKASQLAEAMVARLPNIGFLSMNKRIFAFTVVAGEVQEAISEEKVTMQQAIVATAIAKFSDRNFGKAFDTYLQFAMAGRVDRTMMNRYILTLMQG